MIGIYKITSPIGNVYIGQSTNIESRFKGHQRSTHCGKLQISFRKYGTDCHTFEVIEECEVENLNERERYWQDFYDVLGPKGLNMMLTKTDDKSGYASEEVRKKVSKAGLGKITSEETKLKMSLAAIGRVQSEEHRKKNREARLNMSKETKLKMSESAKRRSSSKEHKEKMSLLHKGKIISEDQKRMISESLRNRSTEQKEVTRKKKSEARIKYWQNKKLEVNV